MERKKGQAAFCRCLFIITFIVEQFGLMLLMKHQLIASTIVLLLSAAGAIGLQCWYAWLRPSKDMPMGRKIKLVVWLLIALVFIELIIGDLMMHYGVGISANQQVINHYMQVPGDYLVMAFGLVIVAPLVEEGLFRTAIIGRVQHEWFPESGDTKQQNLFLLGIISTILFVMAHITLSGDAITLFLHCLQYAVLGGVFSTVYAYTEDWRVNTTLHVLWNLMTLII